VYAQMSEWYNSQKKPSDNLRRCVMKSYDKFKAEMEAIQQQMVEAKKN